MGCGRCLRVTLQTCASRAEPTMSAPIGTSVNTFIYTHILIIFYSVIILAFLATGKTNTCASSTTPCRSGFFINSLQTFSLSPNLLLPPDLLTIPSITQLKPKAMPGRLNNNQIKMKITPLFSYSNFPKSGCQCVMEICMQTRGGKRNTQYVL